jgi:hypothetical protein
MDGSYTRGHIRTGQFLKIWRQVTQDCLRATTAQGEPPTGGGIKGADWALGSPAPHWRMCWPKRPRKATWGQTWAKTQDGPTRQPMGVEEACD